jgi:hypothetical protein
MAITFARRCAGACWRTRTWGRGNQAAVGVNYSGLEHQIADEVGVGQPLRPADRRGNAVHVVAFVTGAQEFERPVNFADRADDIFFKHPRQRTRILDHRAPRSHALVGDMAERCAPD